jgi:hypothetical protein
MDFIVVDEERLCSKCCVLAQIQTGFFEKEAYEMPLDVKGMIVGLMHYVQDFVRLGQPVIGAVELDGLSAEQLIGKPYQANMIQQAIVNVDIRNVFKSKAEAWIAKNNPGDFISSVDCFSNWDPKILLFLSGIPGASSVPLSYVIRKESWKFESQSHIAALAAMAPLDGPVFSADLDAVYQYLQSFIANDLYDHWFDDDIHGGDGHKLMDKMRHYYGSEVLVAPARKVLGDLKDDCLYDDILAVVGLNSNSREGAAESKFGLNIPMTIGMDHVALLIQS